MWQQRQFLGLIFVAITLLLNAAVAVPPPTDYDTVFSYNLSSSVTPCRIWIFPCLGGVYQCSSQNIYAGSFIGPQPACPTLQNATATPPPGVCSLANDSCAFVPDAPTCVSWFSNCDRQYSCTTEEGFTAAVEEGQDCYPITPRPPSPNSVCVPADGSCEWYNPCHTWQGWCNGAYQCGTVEAYSFFVNGPQPLCVLPPENATQPVPAGECVYQDGQCAWSECVSWRSPCQTSWECGSDYEHRVAQSQPLPPCPAPPGQFMPPPEPGVCQISPESQSCEFLGEPECTGGQVYTTCGTLCPRTCENFQLDFACTSECVRGCFCPDDTVLHDGQCIPSWQCPGENPCYLVDCAPGYECLVYEATGEAYCSPNCEELNPCAPDEQCVLTTVYCIRAPCPPILSCQGCTGGKVWTECGTACPETCDNYDIPIACTLQCVTGCFCPTGQVELNGGCIDPTLCSACNSCKEGEVCSVVGESNGARYPICKGPTTVPCSGGSGEPHFSACPEDYRCVTHNTTNIRYCLQSCYLENGGCPPEQVCYYERKDEDCNQLLEPCFKTACTDVPDVVAEDACPIGWENNECASACQSTCEDYLNPRIRPCIAVCAKCQCPYGMVVFRDRCVDPLECQILLNESIPLNPLPQPESVLLVQFALVGVTRDTVDSAGFATSARNLLSREGVHVQVEVYAVLEENGNTVVVLKFRADRDQLSSVANLLMDNSDALSTKVSSASVVATPQQEEEEDDDDGDDVSAGVIAGSIVAAVFTSSVVILVLVIIAVLVARSPKLKHVHVPLDEKEKPLDGLSYASLVSKGTENDYEIS